MAIRRDNPDSTASRKRSRLGPDDTPLSGLVEVAEVALRQVRDALAEDELAALEARKRRRKRSRWWQQFCLALGVGLVGTAVGGGLTQLTASHPQWGLLVASALSAIAGVLLLRRSHSE